MSDVAVQQGTGVYEPSLFGTYSKKIGMWLFLLSDSLTFGALLYAYTYGRISTPNWPTPFPFREHPERDLHDGVSAHQFADHGVCGALPRSWETRKRSGCGCSPPWPAAWDSSFCTAASGPTSSRKA